MDDEGPELRWLTEILRSHQEATEQLAALPQEERGALAAELAHRQIVLESEGVAELIELMTAHGKDMARHREEAMTMAPAERKALEEAITSRLADIRGRIGSIGCLLDSI